MATVLKAEDLLAQLAAVNPASLENNPGQTMEALKLCRQLTATLEAPLDRALNYIFKVSSYLEHASGNDDSNTHTAILNRSTSISRGTQPV